MGRKGLGGKFGRGRDVGGVGVDIEVSVWSACAFDSAGGSVLDAGDVVDDNSIGCASIPLADRGVGDEVVWSI